MQSKKRAIAGIAVRRTMVRKANTKGKYAAENGNAADSSPGMTSEKVTCDFSRSATGSVHESSGGNGQS